MKRNIFLNVAFSTAAHSRLAQMSRYTQHGSTSCLLHSIAVAYYCYRLARRFKFLKLRENELIRGALLHDYFLYDWHIPNNSRPMHGRYHPTAACLNAESDFNLTDCERDIIKKHMFPLTFTPPAFRESYIVCLVDKVCSIYEIFKKNPYRNKQIRTVFKKIRCHSHI